jgi:hypothetical protein
LHRQLVRMLSVHVAEAVSGALTSFIDGDRFDRAGIPPLLDGHRPDVYAIEQTTRRIIVGEAKTADDIDNEHTRRQLAVYLRHVSSDPCGEIWMAVPMTSAGVAHRVCRAVRHQAGLQHVKFSVTGWLLGPRPLVETWHG